MLQPLVVKTPWINVLGLSAPFHQKLNVDKYKHASVKVLNTIQCLFEFKLTDMSAELKSTLDLQNPQGFFIFGFFYILITFFTVRIKFEKLYCFYNLKLLT